MTSTAFAHLPELAGKIVPSAQSTFRATMETMAEWDEIMRKMGRPPGWRLSHKAREGTRRAVLADWPAAEDLWVFAYGSLMWDPGFHFEEVRRAEIDGYRRSFCMRVLEGRGSDESPAMMLALDQGGDCAGLAFRIAAGLVQQETEIIWRREMIMGHYRPLLVGAATPQGEVTALAFVMNHNHYAYAPGIPLDEIARTIVTGEGVFGTNREYLDNLLAQFGAIGIDDELMQVIGAEVAALNGN